jgi:hypothetical protein
LDEYKLQRHQKTAKYCIEIQNRKREAVVCETCEKKFFSERELKAHVCKSIIIQLKKEIEELRDEVDKLKIKKSKVNSDIISPITDKLFEELSEKLKLEDITKGPYGFANFAVENIFLNRAFCVDISRNKIKYKNEKNEMCIDYNMINLTVKFFSSIKEKALTLINSSIEQRRKTFINNENSLIEEDDFYEDMSSIYDIKTMIKNGSEGIENSKIQDFVKIVCSKILPKLF